jgi:hypothetical protein
MIQPRWNKSAATGVELGASFPAIFHANRQSRYEAERFYKYHFGNALASHPQLKRLVMPFPASFQENSDILVIDFDILETFVRRAESAQLPKLADNGVLTLAVRVTERKGWSQIYQGDIKDIFKCIRHFRTLKELIITYDFYCVCGEDRTAMWHTCTELKESKSSIRNTIGGEYEDELSRWKQFNLAPVYKLPMISCMTDKELEAQVDGNALYSTVERRRVEEKLRRRNSV